MRMLSKEEIVFQMVVDSSNDDFGWYTTWCMGNRLDLETLPYEMRGYEGDYEYRSADEFADAVVNSASWLGTILDTEEEEEKEILIARHRVVREWCKIIEEYDEVKLRKLALEDWAERHDEE